MLMHEIKIVERAEVFLGEKIVCVVYYNMNGHLKAHIEVALIVQKMFICVMFNNRSLKTQ